MLAKARDSAGCVLDDAEREAALGEVGALARMARIDSVDLPAGSFAEAAIRCAAAVIQVRAGQAVAPAGLVDRFDRLGCRAVTVDGSPVVVCGAAAPEDALTPRFIAELWRSLGGETAKDAEIPSLASHVDQFRSAVSLLPSWSREVVTRNSGLVVPFPCVPPESGSGTSRTLPGVLMLPTGVPAPLYAECLLHECLHTELILAEWLTGGDLAHCDSPLPTPWRTVDRPANLLLHGCFVFANVARFMRDRAADYESMPPSWLLSAARGKSVRACDAGSASDFRLAQVREAMQTLRARASFTPVGRRVESAVDSALARLGA